MTITRLAWLVGVALLVLVLNVAISILYMVVYSYIIDPGHDEQYYQEHIQLAAPYSSIIMGVPLMFAAGWWVSRWWEREFATKAAFTIWLVYAVIDIAVLLASGVTATAAMFVTVSMVLKLAAVLLGANIGARRHKPNASVGV